MKKMLLMLLFVVVVSVICIALLPTDAQAANIIISGTCGDDLTWTLDMDGTLIISGTGPMTDPNPSGLWSSDLVKHVIIEPGVTSIVSNAFDNCNSLTSVTIPHGVISIGDHAFKFCSGLTNINIPDSVTRIGNSAFSGCTGLTDITIPHSVTSIGSQAFSGCTSLTAFRVAENNEYFSIDSYGVLYDKTMTQLLQAPGALSGSYEIPDSVTSISEYAFFSCSRLTTVSIPDGVTKIGNDTFSGCTSLTAFRVAEDNKYFTSDDSGVLYNKTMTQLLQVPCALSGSYEIPSSITSIPDRAFSDCSILTNVIIHDGVTSIGDLAFSGCSGLVNVTIPLSVTDVGANVFSQCTDLWHILYTGSWSQWKALQIHSSNTDWFNAIHHTDCTGSEVIDIDKRFCSLCVATCRHEWGLGVVTQEPTCVQEKIFTYTCILCNGTKTESLAKSTTHTYDDENDTICNICGADSAPPLDPAEDAGFPMWISIVAIVAIGGIVALIMVKQKH